MVWPPCLVRAVAPEGMVSVRLGHPVVDDYLEFAAARCRPNTVLAAGFDLKAFFSIVAKDPVEVTTADVLEFIKAQRSAGDPTVIRLRDGESGLSSRTIQRRLSSLSSMFSFLVARGDVSSNAVLRGLSTRRARDRGGRGVPLIRTPQTLPRIAEPAEIDALLGACRRFRDRAMFEAMVFGGLRRCEVLGLRLGDLDGARRQVFIVEGKGGHQRQIPISARWFETVSGYLRHERPETDTDRVFVVLKGKRRGRPFSDEGVKQIFVSTRQRAGLRRITCHELRHTCFTRLREAGMELEALQAQAGHRSLDTTRLYIHLANGWLAEEYDKASQVIDAEIFLAAAEGVGQ
ncbi:MAG: phage integrase family protein [Actinomycetia bacterium]|nr:phage integrase family protein [Actinomycetes bacterium]